MRFPKMNQWISIEPFYADQYMVVDKANEENYIMNAVTARFLKKLDGKTDPYKIRTPLSRHDISRLLKMLSEHGIIRTGRFLSASKGYFLFTVWIPKGKNQGAFTAAIFNFMLQILWLPLLIVGILLFLSAADEMYFEMSWGAYLLGAVIGLIMHEIAHAFSAISYGADVYEIGIGIISFMPGAYTMMDCTGCRRMQRVQISAAGIEMIFFLAGLALILSVCIPKGGSAFCMAAFSNIILGCVNLILKPGLDGMSIFAGLIGSDGEEFSSLAKAIVSDRKKRKSIRQKGLVGSAVIVTSYMTTIVRYWLVIEILISFMEVMYW